MITFMRNVHSRNTRSHEFYLQIPNVKTDSFGLKGSNK
jgi:hypothetical protein